MTVDELSSGREPRRWTRVLAAGLVGLVVVGVLGDRVVRSRERSSLRACVTAAQGDLDDLARRTAAVEVYIGSTVDRPDVAPSVRASLRGLVSQTVQRGLPALQRDAARCAGVRAWHGPVRAARRDYRAYLSLRVVQAERAVADASALHTTVPALDAARSRSRTSLAALGIRLTS